MEKKPTRRIVTGHDADGKAVVLFDGPSPHVRQRSEGSNVLTAMWVTSEMPVEMSSTDDRALTKTGTPPNPNSTIFRIVDFAPYKPGDKPIDHHKMLTEMGIDPATQGYARHDNTHRTRSIDYALILEGEIDMLLDDTEVHVKAGDVMVQQGTSHAWVNRGDKPCRIAFILIDAKEPPAWKQGWTKK